MLVRKLAPAISSRSAPHETGWAYLGDHVPKTGASDAYFEDRRSSNTIRKRRPYTPIRPPSIPRPLSSVDDGLPPVQPHDAALTACAKQSAKLICAVPVSPADTLEKVARLADDVVCLETPANFYAVGQFYLDFPQVEDDEVVAILGAPRRG